VPPIYIRWILDSSQKRTRQHRNLCTTMALPDKQRRQARIFTKSAASSAQCAIATITARITRIYEEGRGRPMSSIARGQTHRG